MNKIFLYCGKSLNIIICRDYKFCLAVIQCAGKLIRKTYRHKHILRLRQTHTQDLGKDSPYYLSVYS